MSNLEYIISLIKPLWSGALLLVGSWLLLPLALWVLPKFKSKRSAALFHSVFGVVLCFLLFKWDTLILVVGIIIGYYAISMAKPLHGSLIGFAINCFAHVLYAIRSAGWAVDISGNCMCLFMKITATAYNLSDGRKKKAGEEIKRKRWDDVALDEKPSFLNWFAYCMTPYGAFGNPFIEYKLFDYALDVGNRKPISEDDKKLALNRYLWSFVYAAVNLFTMNYIDETIYDSEFYTNLVWCLKILFMVVITFIQLSRYFTAWYCVEAGYFALGLYSSDIIPGDEVQNNQLTYILQSTSCTEYMRRWNHTTHLFWKNYLYTRMLNCGFKPFTADTAVFAASCTWHGFRPVFYIMFPETIAIMSADKMLQKTFPLEESSSVIKKLAYNAWTILMMAYACSTFYYPSVRRFISFRNSVYWSPFILAIGVVILCKIKAKSQKKTKKE